MSRQSVDQRRTAWATLGVGVAGFVLLAWWLVPWHPAPTGLRLPEPDELFTAEQIARAEAYSGQARAWSWASLATSVLLACWLGFTAAGRRLVARWPGPWWAQVCLGVAALTLIGRLATLPFSVGLRGHRVEFGLTRQPMAGFLRDVAVSGLVTIAVTSMVLLAVIGCARRWPRRWPAVAGGLLAAGVVLGSFVYPVLIEPLFNDFESLPDGQLRTEVLRLADAEGVRLDDVLVADASRRTTTLNAYVSGLGETRRVVLYDTLVEDLPMDQALSVVAHELAHAAHGDVWVGTVLGACGALIGVGAGALLLIRARHPMARPEVVPLVLALVALGSLLSAPVQSGISRQIETRADVAALEATGDPDGFVGMQRRLALRSLSDPTPIAWSQWWFGTHPTVRERVGLAEALSRTSRSSPR